MPRIETLRLLRWAWVAWNENDYGERSYLSFGFTHERAVDRCSSKLMKGMMS